MKAWRLPSWHTLFLVLLLTAIAADVMFGLDVVLNALSIVVAATLGVAVLSVVGLGIGALAWITIRDAVEGTRSDRRDRLAWRWRLVAYVGIVGILVDGAVGAWNVYQQHVLFSTAVEDIPFAGVPVWLLLASYPIKWLEQAVVRRS